MVKDLKYFTERLGIIQNDVITAKDKLQQFEPSLKELNQSISFEREKQDTCWRKSTPKSRSFPAISVIWIKARSICSILTHGYGLSMYRIF